LKAGDTQRATKSEATPIIRRKKKLNIRVKWENIEMRNIEITYDATGLSIAIYFISIKVNRSINHCSTHLMLVNSNGFSMARMNL
jgi:hypothetical protein